MYSVTHREIVYNNKLHIESAQVEHDGKQYQRLRINREDAAVVLVWNSETEKYILTRQFRYAVYDKTTSNIIEAVAGKVENEEPLHTAIRETEEEVGYRVKEKNIRLLASCFAAPGYSTEKYFIYYATVTNADKVSNGGGLKDEGENIEIIELTPEEFYRMIDEHEIEDSKTYIAALMVQRNVSI